MAEQLPDEVLMKIFSYLSTKDILTNIAAVCKTFNRLSKDPYLIKEICLGTNIRDTNKKDVYKFLYRSSGLTKLIIKGSNRDRYAPIKDCHAEEFVVHAIRSCSNLLHLELWDCLVNNQVARTIVLNQPKLKSFYLYCYRMTHRDTGNNGIITPMFANKGVKHLVHLRLRFCTELDDQVCKCIALNCPELKSIELTCTGYNKITKEGLTDMFANGLKQLVKLKLWKTDNRISDQMLKNIGLNCPDFESLELGYCEHITDEGMLFLIAHCNKLKYLNLSRVILLTDEFLFKINVYLPELCYLNLLGHGPVSYTHLTLPTTPYV